MRLLLRPPVIAALIFLISAASIGGALGFEHAGYLPCELCLKERLPYYLGMPLAALTAWAAIASRRRLALTGFLLLAALFAAGGALAAYHSGVEWKWFAGPQDCSGDLMRASSTSDFLSQLRKVRPVRCDEPALRIIGLSLANMDVIVSLLLASLAAAGARLIGPVGRK